MALRHRNDTVARPWPGAADQTGPLYVPIELRDTVDTIPPDIAAKLRRDVFTTKEMIRTTGKRAHVIHPAADPDDLELAVKWKMIEWAGHHLNGQRVAAEQSASDARHYTCECCAEVVVPGLSGLGHTMIRTFADGTRLKVCGRCFPVVERLAAERVGLEMVDGVSRLDRARQLLEPSTT